MRLNAYINESKAVISPLMKSVIGKKWDKITKEEADTLVSELAKIGGTDTSFSLVPSIAGKMKGNNFVSISRKDKSYEDVSKQVEKMLVNNGWKVVKSIAGDGKTWWVYFNKG